VTLSTSGRGIMKMAFLTQRILTILVFLVMGISCVNANTLQQVIEERLESDRRANIKGSEGLGDYSESEIDPSRLNKKPREGKAKIDGVFDIKGIKIGMTTDEVIPLIKKSIVTRSMNGDSKRGCPRVEFLRAFDVTNPGGGTKRVLWGDLVLHCGLAGRGPFKYFGEEIQADFYLIQPDGETENNPHFYRLNYAKLRMDDQGDTFNRDKNSMPLLVQTLAKKYKINPEIIFQPHHRHPKTLGVYKYIWSDSNSDTLSVTTDVEFSLSGVEHKNQVLEMTEKSFISTMEKRKLRFKNLQIQQKKQIDNERDADL
jgi:hypothetical protein